MSDLPHGWTEATLGDIALSVKNGIFVSRPKNDPDGVPILRISSVRSLRLDLSDIRYSTASVASLKESDALLQEGDLLFTRYNGNPEYVGACARVPALIDSLTYPDKLIRVRIDERVCDPRFVMFAFAAPAARDQVRGLSRTTAGQIGISGGSLQRVRIPLPPLTEQRRIVATLEDHWSHFDRALRTFSDLKLQIQSLRDALLESYFCNEAIKDKCPRVSLGSLGKTITGSTPDPRNPDYWSGDLPFVTPRDISDGQRVSSASRGLTKSGANAARILDPGAVLTVCIGATLGKVGWIDRDCAINQQINAIQPDLKVVNPEFMSYLLASPSLQRELWTRSSSTTLPILNKGRFEKIEIHLPPLEEQLKIIVIIREWESAITRLKSQLANGLLRAEQLRRSLLHQAFAGQLVPQEPTDTPAPVLLERMRAERATRPKTGRGRMGATKARQEETLL